ncbi:ferulic acid esterase [Aspergillus filifer]
MDLTSFIVAAAVAATAFGAALHHVDDFGENPGNTGMWIYVPDELAPSPAVIVALHGCLDSPQGYFAETPDLRTASQELGFIIIYPSATNKDFRCWDAATNATLTHDGGSDSLSIVNMVSYALDTYNGDAGSVFAMGSSSGAIMSLQLAAAYPDVFSAVAAYSGFPVGCWRGQPGSSPLTADPGCIRGTVEKTGAEWAAEVHRAWPSYTGSYPKVQVWHGTADFVISFKVFDEIINQWTAVFGIEKTDEDGDDPEKGYTRYTYGDERQFEAYKGQGVAHPVPVHANETLTWFGIM